MACISGLVRRSIRNLNRATHFKFGNRPIPCASCRQAHTYYDSQSGGLITVGGQAKIHDVTFKQSSNDSDLDTLQKILAGKRTNLHVQSVEVPKDCLGKFVAFKTKSSAGAGTKEADQTALYMDVHHIRDDSGVFNLDLALSSVKSGLTGCVVDLSTADNAEQKSQTLKIVHTLNAHRIPVRAMLHCDLSSDGADSVISTGGLIGDLADAGAHAIVLVPRRGVDAKESASIDDETLRLLIEEGINLDCAGDPIKQRLGLHIDNSTHPGNSAAAEQALRTAAEYGLCHFTGSLENHKKIAEVLAGNKG